MDGFDIRTNEDESFEVFTWVNHNLVIDVEDQSGYVFDGLSNGCNSRHSEVEIKEDTDAIVAKFVPATPQEGCRTICKFNP